MSTLDDWIDSRITALRILLSFQRIRGFCLYSPSCLAPHPMWAMGGGGGGWGVGVRGGDAWSCLGRISALSWPNQSMFTKSEQRHKQQRHSYVSLLSSKPRCLG